MLKSIDAKLARILHGGSSTTPGGPIPDLEARHGDWQEWLKALHASLWQTHRDEWSPNPIMRKGFSTECRRLTPEEWEAVQEVIRERKPICEPHNACMGFGIGMALYEEPPRISPGYVPEPEFLADITKEHLPLTVCALREDPKDRAYTDRTFFEDGWRAFSPFTHGEENAKLLVEYGFDAPKSKGHYDY